MFKRKIIPTEQLNAWMTSELRKFDGCEECHVLGPNITKEPDEEGCNWSVSVIRAPGVPQEVWRPALMMVIAIARAEFNVGQY